jgi:hypothetical protein
MDKLQIRHQIAQAVERSTLQQRFTFDDDEHVKFTRRKQLRFQLVLLELWSIGSEQLAQRIIDLDARDAESGCDCQYRRNRSNDGWDPQR